jgi:hypothetical protein
MVFLRRGASRNQQHDHGQKEAHGKAEAAAFRPFHGASPSLDYVLHPIVTDGKPAVKSF